MKLPFISKPKQNKIQPEETLLALDVGTRFIKAVIFRYEEDEVKVIGYAKVPQQSNSMHSAMIVNLKNVIAATDICVGKALSVADRIEGHEVPLPKKAIMGIAGELVKGVTIVADYDRDKPDKKIEQKEIDEVVNMVKSQLFSKVHEDISNEMGLTTAQVEEIDTKVVAAHIDGVKIDNPIGFTGNHVEYSIYSTFSPTIHLNSLKELAQQLGLEIIEIVVEPYAVARAVKGAHKEAFSAIFVDVGGGTTDVALVSRGAVMGTKMFAFGGQVFSKRLMVEFNVSADEAEEMKLDYSNQKLSDVKAKKVSDALSKDIPIWTEGVEIALGDIDEVEQFPDQMFFCGGGSHLPDLRSGILSHPWLQVHPFKKFPKMSYVFPNQLEGLTDLTKKMIDPMDVAPAALALMIREIDNN